MISYATENYILILKPYFEIQKQCNNNLILNWTYQKKKKEGEAKWCETVLFSIMINDKLSCYKLNILQYEINESYTIILVLV